MKNLMLLSAVVFASVASAQERAAPSDGNITYSRSTSVEFAEGDLIEGELNKPDGEVVTGCIYVLHPNLIRVRQDFNDKLMQSVGEL